MVETIYPIMIVTAAAGILVNFLQIGALFTTKPLVPDLKKIDPIKGAKNIFSLEGFVELLKSLFKLAVIAVIAYRFLMNNLNIFENSIHQGLDHWLLLLV